MVVSQLPDPKLLINLLDLNQNQTLLILFDRFGFEIAHWVAEVATENYVTFSARYVPILTQTRYAASGGIPGDLKERLEQSQVLITAISDYEVCTYFRATVLQAAKNSLSKILHLPGVDWLMFLKSLQGFDLNVLQEEACRLKQILEGSNILEIYTRDFRKRLHKLSLSVDNRLVHIDIGKPAPGEIAQLPAGEIYLAPLEFIAEGSIVINGSVPERVLRMGNEAILNFNEGVVSLKRSEFAKTLSCNGFRDELSEYASRDRNNLALGEVGFGINQTITRLTGSPVHDEKAAGTMHLALGCNTPFGGVIECDSHMDLIFIPECVRVDGKDLPINWGLGT